MFKDSLMNKRRTFKRFLENEVRVEACRRNSSSLDWITWQTVFSSNKTGNNNRRTRSQEMISRHSTCSFVPRFFWQLKCN